jgi:DNA-directed RNA polymerase subunit RPC12/RpoP
MTTLYVYLCTNCDTLNHIHWQITEFNEPHCCECSERNFYKFIAVLEAKPK